MTSAIRLARPGDLPAVEEIVLAAYEGYVPRIGRKPAPMLDDYSILIEGQHVYLLSDEHGPAGILVLVVEERAMLLDNVAVHPRAQGRGHGRALIAFAESVAREQGLAAIQLYTNEAMTENVALYKMLGFMETHRGQENGFRRVYMTKALDALL